MDIVNLNNGIDGNPRKAIHFLEFTKEIGEDFTTALNRAKQFQSTAKAYRGKKYGGMIVFTDLWMSKSQIEEAINGFMSNCE